MQRRGVFLCRLVVKVGIMSCGRGVGGEHIVDTGHAGGIGISARATALQTYRSLSSVAVISLSAYFPV